MNFIKKIFNKQIDEKVHNQFTKFGPGTFENRAIIDLSVTSKGIVKMKTSPEFTNELVEFLANTITGSIPVKGLIFASRDLTEESPIEFTQIKNAMGIKKHIVDANLTKEQILKACKKFPFNSINLSFETSYGKLKIKEKAPKSGKSGKGDSNPKADYCVLTNSDKSILGDYLFDVKEPFKKAFIKHTIHIDEIIVPEEYKNDFAKARLMAKRKGKIVRSIVIDKNDNEEIVEKSDFEI